MIRTVLLMLSLAVGISASAREYHVSVRGDDAACGSERQPFRTISRAAAVARAGDVVTVHEGTYREWIRPEYGGTSDSLRIVYRAAPGEEAVVKGSEIVQGWTHVGDGVWKVSLPDSLFGGYNPYRDVIEGDWFVNKGRDHHTGEVYLNGKSFYEVETLDKVLRPEPLADAVDSAVSLYVWYCEADSVSTTIWANFHAYDPNRELVEINVRPACFYPLRTGVDYITVRGFRFAHAATQWAPPTAEQIGLIGTNWSKGWIIEDNVISDSKCTGITLGKDRASGHNVWIRNPEKDGSVHYIEVIFRAREQGWEKESVGSHVVRNNTVFDCGQAGICGSLGAAFSRITGNHIYNIWQKRQFDGPEIAAIKIHGAIDVLIARNRIHHATMGFFMDWMAQGTRISSNLLYGNDVLDIYMEVNHGPYLVDNNLLLSPLGVMSMSQGGAFVHNLIAGRVKTMSDPRFTPYFFAHSTHLAGFSTLYAGDDRWYNNWFTGTERTESPALRQRGYFVDGVLGLGIYDNGKIGLPVYAEGNVYFNEAVPCAAEKNAVRGGDLDLVLSDEGTHVDLEIASGTGFGKHAVRAVTTDLLGETKLSGQKFEHPDGTPLTVDTDYFGAVRPVRNPASGPFEDGGAGGRLRLW